MKAAISQTPRFIRRTTLAAQEYHKNFHQIDADIIASITSPEADAVTPLMSKIYLRLVTAPTKFWEQKGVLYFTAKMGEGPQIKASKVLYEVLGVASATAHKALLWMHEQGIIGYFAGKNGVGIRIFLNRAASSIGIRDSSPVRKILPFTHGSPIVHPGSTGEPAFNDSFAVLDNLDTEINPRAPENGADTQSVAETLSDPPAKNVSQPRAPTQPKGREVKTVMPHSSIASMNEIIERLRRELEPCLKNAATHAAAQAATREIARTREWFETRALPKAVRVAQHETYDLLRKHGTLDEREKRARADLQVGRAANEYTPPEAHQLTPEEITQTAQMCIALLEVQGKSIDATLFELSPESGGWLLPEDALQVQEAAQRLLLERSGRR